MWHPRVHLVREPPACSAFTDSAVASSWSFGSSSAIDHSLRSRLLPRLLLQSPNLKQQHVKRHLSTTSSSERGKRFRRRKKLYEESLRRQVDALRKQIAQLSVQKNLVAQNTLMTRTSPCGSLVQLTRELYKLYQCGLNNVATTHEMHNLPRSVSVVEYKENFLRHLLDADVTYGTLVGVHSVIDQWRKHTASYAKFELEVMYIEPIDDFEQNPVVTTHIKQHARFSRETFPLLFPFVPGNRDDLMEKMAEREITFDCVSRFQFSSQGQITMYLVEINFIEALIGVFGNAQDAAELIQLSVITPAATLMNAAPNSERRFREPRRQATETQIGSSADHKSSDGPVSSKLSVEYLLS
ncbi:hypothetical protein FI667_g15423, partial [Globisporangium splendens]